MRQCSVFTRKHAQLLSICLLACANAVSPLTSMHHCSLSNSKHAQLLSLNQQTCIAAVYLLLACATAVSPASSMHQWRTTNVSPIVSMHHCCSPPFSEHVTRLSLHHEVRISMDSYPCCFSIIQRACTTVAMSLHRAESMYQWCLSTTKRACTCTTAVSPPCRE
jgi:hypothetical protein